MKKFCTFLLILTLIFALTACNNKSNSLNNESSNYDVLIIDDETNTLNSSTNKTNSSNTFSVNTSNYFASDISDKIATGELDLNEWENDKKEDNFTDDENTDYSQNYSDENDENAGIYRTPYGERYHLDPDCGGKNSYEITLDEALDAGLTPCKKCAL